MPAFDTSTNANKHYNYSYTYTCMLHEDIALQCILYNVIIKKITMKWNMMIK